MVLSTAALRQAVFLALIIGSGVCIDDENPFDHGSMVIPESIGDEMAMEVRTAWRADSFVWLLR